MSITAAEISKDENVDIHDLPTAPRKQGSHHLGVADFLWQLMGRIGQHPIDRRFQLRDIAFRAAEDIYRGLMLRLQLLALFRDGAQVFSIRLRAHVRPMTENGLTLLDNAGDRFEDFRAHFGSQITSAILFESE